MPVIFPLLSKKTRSHTQSWNRNTEAWHLLSWCQGFTGRTAKVFTEQLSLLHCWAQKFQGLGLLSSGLANSHLQLQPQFLRCQMQSLKPKAPPQLTCPPGLFAVLFVLASLSEPAGFLNTRTAQTWWKREKLALTSQQLLLPMSVSGQRDWDGSPLLCPSHRFGVRSLQVSAGTWYPVWRLRRVLPGKTSPTTVWWTTTDRTSALALSRQLGGQDDPCPQHRALDPNSYSPEPHDVSS